MESVKHLIESDQYKALLEMVRRDANIQIDEAPLPSALLNYDVGRLKAAKIDASVLEGILATDLEAISKYSVARLNFQEDEDEGQDEDEKDTLIEELPQYKNFLVFILIEYYFLKNKPSDIAAYLKATRMPNAKKFEKELKEAFSSI